VDILAVKRSNEGLIEFPHQIMRDLVTLVLDFLYPLDSRLNCQRIRILQDLLQNPGTGHRQ
jgi:hypothetical protein